ncbi:hypothetical protein L9F63_011967, partial [Diploptera punctata]
IRTYSIIMRIELTLMGNYLPLLYQTLHSEEYNMNLREVTKFKKTYVLLYCNVDLYYGYPKVIGNSKTFEQFHDKSMNILDSDTSNSLHGNTNSGILLLTYSLFQTRSKTFLFYFINFFICIHVDFHGRSLKTTLEDARRSLWRN